MRYSTILYITVAILAVLFGFLVCVQLFSQVNSGQLVNPVDQVIQTVDHATFEDLPPIMIP